MKRLCLSNQFFTLSILFLGLCLTPSLIAQQGKVLSLDGDGDYIVVQDSNTLFTNVPFTVETWFNMETIASDWYTVIGNDEYEIHLDRNSRISVWDNGAGTLTGHQTIESNRWYHVAFVNDGQSRRIYLNGLLDVEANDASALKDAVQQLWIGNDPAPPNRHFNRLVDEVRVWNIARSAEEIRNNMTQHLTGGEDGLVGYWNFDQGVAMDASGNDNHGALHGDASIVEADFPHSPIAIQIYEDLVAAHLTDISIKQNLIQSYRTSGQDEKVQSVLDQMLAQIGEGSYKDNPSLVDSCADILIDLEQFEDAQTVIEKLSDAWPEHPRPMELMAKLYDAMGQTDKANEYRVRSDPGQKLVGLTASDFQLANLDGDQVSLSQFVGQPVILNFWATW